MTWPPTERVTVSVPVPSPLKTLNPAALDGVGAVTPNAGGKSVALNANAYRPFNVAGVHRRGPSSFDAARLPERLTPARMKRATASVTLLVRRNHGELVGPSVFRA